MGCSGDPRARISSAPSPVTLEKLPHRFKHQLLLPTHALTIRQGAYEHLAIMFFQNSPIENHDGATVRLAANKSPETLFEFNYSLRNRVFQKRVTTSLSDRLNSGLDHRLLGDAKGKFRQDHIF